MIERICPVCGQKSDSNTVYCSGCGWEYRVFPEVVSQAVKDSEQKRLSVAQQVFADNNRKMKLLEDELTSLKQQLVDKDNQLQLTTNELVALKNAPVSTNYAYLVQSYNGILQNVYPIGEGDTIFGSAFTQGDNYRQILEGSLAIQHFVVRTTLNVNPRGRKKASYMLIPGSGKTDITAPGNMITSPVPLPLLEKFFAGGLTFQLLDDVDT